MHIEEPGGTQNVRATDDEYQQFNMPDEQLFVMLARVLASELERESNERDLRRFNDMLRDQARGMGAVGRVAKALAVGEDARTAVCEAACEVGGERQEELLAVRKLIDNERSVALADQHMERIALDAEAGEARWKNASNSAANGG